MGGGEGSGEDRGSSNNLDEQSCHSLDQSEYLQI